MNVKQLKKILEGVEDSRIVVMSSDGEGNSFSPLADVSERGKYEADSTYSGDFSTIEKLTKEDIADGFTEEDIARGEKAICLWPTN
jgi:hypothetical protein